MNDWHPNHDARAEFAQVAWNHHQKIEQLLNKVLTGETTRALAAVEYVRLAKAFKTAQETFKQSEDTHQ